MGVENLDGGAATYLIVHRLVDRAHAALAELAHDSVVADALVNHGIQNCSLPPGCTGRLSLNSSYPKPRRRGDLSSPPMGAVSASRWELDREVDNMRPA